ncbi:hypothetical protein AVEN_256462-1, partial [Araneus ventricosus]
RRCVGKTKPDKKL